VKHLAVLAVTEKRLLPLAVGLGERIRCNPAPDTPPMLLTVILPVIYRLLQNHKAPCSPTSALICSRLLSCCSHFDRRNRGMPRRTVRQRQSPAAIRVSPEPPVFHQARKLVMMRTVPSTTCLGPSRRHGPPRVHLARTNQRQVLRYRRKLITNFLLQTAHTHARFVQMVDNGLMDKFAALNGDLAWAFRQHRPGLSSCGVGPAIRPG